jgi:hypothetical protein
VRLTVPTAVPTREVPTVLGKVVAWANKEVMPVLRQLRDAANLEGALGSEVTTGGAGTFGQLWQSDPMPTNSSWMIEARVIGRSTTGPVQTVGYVMRGLFQNDSGAVTQIGVSSTPFIAESDAGYEIRFVISAQRIVLEVQDDGVSATRFTAKVLLLHQPVG